MWHCRRSPRGLQREDQVGGTVVDGTRAGGFPGGEPPCQHQALRVLRHCSASAGAFFWLLAKHPVPEHLLRAAPAVLPLRSGLPEVGREGAGPDPAPTQRSSLEAQRGMCGAQGCLALALPQCWGEAGMPARRASTGPPDVAGGAGPAGLAGQTGPGAGPLLSPGDWPHGRTHLWVEADLSLA